MSTSSSWWPRWTFQIFAGEQATTLTAGARSVMTSNGYAMCQQGCGEEPVKNPCVEAISLALQTRMSARAGRQQDHLRLKQYPVNSDGNLTGSSTIKSGLENLSRRPAAHG